MRFWLCQDEIPDDHWQIAIHRAIPTLALTSEPVDVDDVLAAVLGEAQFGPGHWRLSPAKRLYYLVKPLLPRALRYLLRRLCRSPMQRDFLLDWPIEERYVRFQWEVMRQLLIATRKNVLTFRHFWPEGHRFAFVLTHDIETANGQSHVRAVARLEEDLGFRSSFNFVPERYALDYALMQDLRDRGFEIGLHGLKHDGKLFNSGGEFTRRAERINRHLKEFGAVGFRAPLTQRHPEWMQLLEIEYDLSFFDTDPFEVIPGGAMSIWPYLIGHFVELPYTLVQDCTLTAVLGETTPRLWLDKVDFIEHYWGMALVNAHPDYLRDRTNWDVYADFLEAMRGKRGYWHALPREVARWWRRRAEPSPGDSPSSIAIGKAVLADGTIALCQ
jgi:hypothetical protein